MNKKYEYSEILKMANELYFALEICEINSFLKIKDEICKNNKNKKIPELLDYIQDKVESEYGIKPLDNNDREDYNLQISKIVLDILYT